MMQTTLHKSDTRGYANHGWLQSFHSFSFANYYNPKRMHFGVLRVLNDDSVAGGKGFGQHPHDNMEIISIVLKGALEHQDSMGTKAVIQAGDIQVMSAGTGVVHSEYNHSATEEVQFLQIWLFPNKRNATPRYDQSTVDLNNSPNQLVQVLSPDPDDAGVWIHQNAWFFMGQFNDLATITHHIKATNNGVYLFVIQGQVRIGETVLEQRDAIGVWDTSTVTIAIEEPNTQLLLMDIPMQM
jgi:quercetin 2,3-dioxygenase